MTPAAMTPEEFRALFPALRTTSWLATQGSPPGFLPVLRALRRALDDWESGAFSWPEWDAVAAGTRGVIAQSLGVGEHQVALMTSVAEGTATVAKNLPPGRILLDAGEFRSTLYPWLASARHDVVTLPSVDPDDFVAQVATHIDERTRLVAVSEVLPSNGQRIDVGALRALCDAAGADLLVDATQTMGVLCPAPAGSRPDYLCVHGYKWLLCPRGSAWLVVPADRAGQLEPLAPGWKSTPAPHGYFGGPLCLADSAARCDTSPAWLSWIGAAAALPVVLGLPAAQTEAYCVGLARRFATATAALGAAVVSTAGNSHIAVIDVRDGQRVAQALAERGVRAAVRDGRLTAGFHYFNTEDDVEQAVDAVRAGGG